MSTSRATEKTFVTGTYTGELKSDITVGISYASKTFTGYATLNLNLTEIKDNEFVAQLEMIGHPDNNSYVFFLKEVKCQGKFTVNNITNTVVAEADLSHYKLGKFTKEVQFEKKPDGSITAKSDINLYLGTYSMFGTLRKKETPVPQQTPTEPTKTNTIGLD